MDSIIKMNEYAEAKPNTYGIDNKITDLTDEKNSQFASAQKHAETKLNQDQIVKQPFFSCLSIEYYQPFFNIESNDISKRLLYSFKPFKPDFIGLVHKNPDMYGPFWIYATLVFLVAAAGNLSRYMRTDEAFKPNFSLVPTAAVLILGFGFIFPLILSMIMKFFGSNVSYIQVLCIYGYSLTCFIPVSLLCIIPSDILQWMLLLYGILNSTAFLLVNYWSELGNYIDKKRYIVLSFVGASQILMLLVYKLYFFSKIYHE